MTGRLPRPTPRSAEAAGRPNCIDSAACAASAAATFPTPSTTTTRRWRWRLDSHEPIVSAAGLICSPTRPGWPFATSSTRFKSTRTTPKPMPAAGSARVRLGRLGGGLADAERALERARPSARLCYIAAQTYSQAAEATHRGRVATRTSLDHEARATNLLQLAIEQTAPELRAQFWRKTILRDLSLRPLLRNPRIVQRLEATVTSARGPFVRKTDSGSEPSR